jgi:hypothetical protein
MNEFVLGAIAALAGMVALLFLRAWRRVPDRLFLMFAFAFAILSVNQLGFAMTSESAEWLTRLYVVRLMAYLVILAAILDKNRSRE